MSAQGKSMPDLTDNTGQNVAFPTGNVRLSQADIEAGKTAKGGFTRSQLAAWGVPWPPPKG